MELNHYIEEEQDLKNCLDRDKNTIIHLHNQNERQNKYKDMDQHNNNRSDCDFDYYHGQKENIDYFNEYLDRCVEE